jgi:hypothetical protein
MNWEGFGRKLSWPNFTLLSRHLPEITEENNRKLKTARSKPGTSRICRRSANHSTKTFGGSHLVVSLTCISCNSVIKHSFNMSVWFVRTTEVIQYRMKYDGYVCGNRYNQDGGDCRRLHLPEVADGKHESSDQKTRFYWKTFESEHNIKHYVTFLLSPVTWNMLHASLDIANWENYTPRISTVFALQLTGKIKKDEMKVTCKTWNAYKCWLTMSGEEIIWVT